MHYVAIRDQNDLAGKPMTVDYITGAEDSPNFDRMMVWACTTHAGALYWALARFSQARPLTSMHVYGAVLDEASIQADPNIAMPSSVMAASGTLGTLLGFYKAEAEVLDALRARRGEDTYVDRALAG